MSILKDLVKEMAVGGSTSAGSVAITPNSLFGGGAVDHKKAKRKKNRMLRRAMYMSNEDIVYISPSPKWNFIGEAISTRDLKSDASFDSIDVLSKLDAAESKANAEKNVVTFGLEDEEGNIIRVRVRAEQAEEFEATLATMLAGEDTDKDHDNSMTEIAEVLHELKDKFEIVDVDWGTIEGDEEEEQTQEVTDDEGNPEAGEMEGNPEDGDMEGEGNPEDGDMEADMEAEMGEPAGEEAAVSALQQVIDMMKAEADAKKAEANAKEAEAKAREAEFVTKASMEKVRQEEEILDMEAYYDKQKEESAEAKRLAKLAKFRHDKASDAGATLASESVEPKHKENHVAAPAGNPDNEDETTIENVAVWILQHLKSQG